MIKRYGTSSMPCDSGIYVLYSEYERVVAECADWKRRWQDAVDHASEAITERNHWQANHDHQVARARFLIERGDIPVERVRAYEEMEALREDATRYQWLKAHWGHRTPILNGLFPKGAMDDAFDAGIDAAIAKDKP
jgi:hypothetical protein